MAARSNAKLESVRRVVGEHFPDLWPAIEVGLSTCATLLLADNANPVAVIYVGPPSAGKTTVVSMFDGSPVCYRSDKFTPASFVTQSPKVAKSQLKNVDLLPRIKHKVLLTPEMASTFRGKQDELAERFATYTRVLDGQGWMTDSGTHGRRGYEGDYLFAWLGATTPLDPLVWKVMAQLGSRLFFLNLDAVADPTVEELSLALTKRKRYEKNLPHCRKAVHRLLQTLFKRHKGVKKVKWRNEQNPPEVINRISQCAKLLAVMRTPYEEIKPCHPESPFRANEVLYNLARGHALVCGRVLLTKDDLPMIARITLSSMPAERQAVLLAFARNLGEPLSVKEVQDATEVSRHTAERVMAEMDWLGVAQFEKEGPGIPAQLTLKPEWAWIAEGEFAALLLDGGTWQKSGVVLQAVNS